MVNQLIDFLKSLPLWSILIISALVLFIITLLVLRIFRQGGAIQIGPIKIEIPHTHVPNQPLSNDNASLIFQNLKGRWDIYYGFREPLSDTDSCGFAEIESQKDNDFRMRVTLLKSKNGRKIHNVFEYEGKIINNQILATFKSSKSVLSFMCGTIVMFPHPQGDKIFCRSTYVNRLNQLMSDNSLFIRKNS